MPTRRQRRVSELVRRELSLLLLHQVRDPRLSSVTITGVEVTQDLLLARVHFRALGDTKETSEALAGLEHAAGYLRTQLAARVELRHVPELVFAPDRSAEYGQRIDELLDQLKESGQFQDDPGPA
jgi:ribosome-binding factor A